MKTDQIKAIKNKPEITRLQYTEDGKVKITWKKAVGAEKYIIKRSKKVDCEFKKIAEVKADKLTALDKTVTQEGLYFYRVTAFTANGENKPITKTSESKSINISSLPAPKMVEISASKEDAVSLKWENSEDCDGYIVLRRHSFMSDAVKIAVVGKEQTTFTDEKPVMGQLLYYSVQLFKESLTEDLPEDFENILGVQQTGKQIVYSNQSNELCFATADSPIILETKRKLGKKVVFSLMLTAGAEGYILFKAKEENGNLEEVMRTKGIDSLRLLDKGKKGEKGAYYCAAAYKTNGDTVFIGKKSPLTFAKY